MGIRVWRRFDQHGTAKCKCGTEVLFAPKTFKAVCEGCGTKYIAKQYSLLELMVEDKDYGEKTRLESV